MAKAEGDSTLPIIHKKEEELHTLLAELSLKADADKEKEKNGIESNGSTEDIEASSDRKKKDPVDPARVRKLKLSISGTKQKQETKELEVQILTAELQYLMDVHSKRYII